MEKKTLEKKHLDNLKLRRELIANKELNIALLKNERDLYCMRIKEELGLPLNEQWNINFGEGCFEKAPQEGEVQ